MKKAAKGMAQSAASATPGGTGRNRDRDASSRETAAAPATSATAQRTRRLMPRNDSRARPDGWAGDGRSASSLSAAVEAAGANDRAPHRAQTTGLPACSPGTCSASPHWGQQKRITTGLLLTPRTKQKSQREEVCPLAPPNPGQ